MESFDVGELMPNAIEAGAGCKIHPKVDFTGAQATLIKRGLDLDSLIKYNNSHILDIPSTHTVDDLLLIDGNGEVFGVSDEYVKLKEYYLNYNDSKDSWASFGFICADNSNFSTFKGRMNNALRGYFDFIESPISKTKLVKDSKGIEIPVALTKEEYDLKVKNKKNNLKRLLDFARNPDANEYKLFLQLESHGQDIFRNKKLCENYFGINFQDNKAYNRLFNVFKKKAQSGRQLKHSIYNELPSCIQEYFIYNSFVLNEPIKGLELGKRVFITSKTFESLDTKEGIKLFNIMMDVYRKAQGIPEGLDNKLYDLQKRFNELNNKPTKTIAEVEEMGSINEEINRIKKYMELDNDLRKTEKNINALGDETFGKLSNMFFYKALGGNIAASIRYAFNRIISPSVYMAMQIAAHGLKGALSLISINTIQFFTYGLTDKASGFGLNGDRGKFVKAFPFPYTEQLTSFLKMTAKDGDEFYTGGLLGFVRGCHANGAEIWSEMVDLYKGGFYNIGDKIYNPMSIIQYMNKYVNVYHPHIQSVDEFINYLVMLGKDARDAELEKMASFVDDEVYKFHNQSFDKNRNVDYGRESNSIRLQPVLDVASRMRGFFREYMINSFKNTMRIVNEGWNAASSKHIIEKIEQYNNGKITKSQLDEYINNAYSKNEDFTRLISLMMYSTFLAKNVVKADRKSNFNVDGDDEEAVLEDYIDYIQDFNFPLAAFERTDVGLIMNAFINAMQRDYDGDEQLTAIGLEEYKALTKQFTKSLYIPKIIVDAIGRYRNNDEGLSAIDIFWKSMQDVAGSFGYYLEDRIIDSGYETNVHQTSSAVTKLFFGNVDDDKEELGKIKKIIQYKGITNDNIPYDDTAVDQETGEKLQSGFTSFLLYNTPFISDYLKYKFDKGDIEDREFIQALRDFQQTDIYNSFVEGNIPEGLGDGFYDFAYNKMILHEPNASNPIEENFIVDKSFITEDGSYIKDNYREVIKEKIWNRLMLDNVDQNVFNATIDTILNQPEGEDLKTYQMNALRAINYLNALQPGAGQIALGYIASNEVNRNVYSDKYGYYKDKEGNYLPGGKEKLQLAYMIEQIAAAKKYAPLEFIADKQIWSQYVLYEARESGMDIAGYITEPGESNKKTMKISFDGGENTDKDLLMKYEMLLYQDIMASQGNINSYELNNVYNQLSEKIINNRGLKYPDGSYTKKGAEEMLRFFNYLQRHTNEMGLSDSDNLAINEAQMLQSEKYIDAIISQSTDEEIKNNEALQESMHFLWGINKKINELGNEKVYDTVASERDGSDPSKISFSFRKSSSGYKNYKSGKSLYGSGRKNLYTKNSFFNDACRNMGSKYTKYYNYFYTPTKRNATPYYSQKEWEVKGFSRVIASAGGRSGGGSGGTRSEGESQEKASGYTKQRRGAARPFVNWGDLDKIPDRKYKSQNRRTRSYAVGSKVRNKLIPGRRRRIKAVKGDTASMT